MHRARAFFYVCAGILLLAPTNPLGVQEATAQAPDNPAASVTFFGDGYAVALTANGDIYYSEGTGGTTWQPRGSMFSGPPPEGNPVVAVQFIADHDLLALTANGDIYYSNGTGGLTWEPRGNIFGATSSQRESFGAMKSRYRGERRAEQPEDR